MEENNYWVNLTSAEMTLPLGLWLGLCFKTHTLLSNEDSWMVLKSWPWFAITCLSSQDRSENTKWDALHPNITTFKLRVLRDHPQEKAMVPHSSTVAWKIPWMEESGRLQSMGSHRVGHDWSNLAASETTHPVREFLSATSIWRSCVCPYFPLVMW